MLYVATSRRPTPRPATRIRRASPRWRKSQGAGFVVISAAIEAEIAQLPAEESRRISGDDGARGARPRPADPRRLRASRPRHLLHRRAEGDARLDGGGGAKAPQAAGVIHTDFEKGFIRAQTIAYDDFVACGGEVGAKEAGKARDEGKEYVVQDGDVMLFKFNV